MKKPSIPDEPSVKNRFWIPSFEHQATAIGYVCLTYGKIEFYVDGLIADLINCDPSLARAITTNVGPLSKRLTLLRHCITQIEDSKSWVSKFDDLVREIDRVTKTRNRIIHDVWIDAERPTQLDRRAKLGKASAKGENQTLEAVETILDLDQMWDFHDTLQKLNDRLRIFQIEFRMAIKFGVPLR